MAINRRIQALNELELKNVISPNASWHTDYRDTAYIYIGGLPFDLTEGDIVTMFSQFGEPVWLKLARDKETGKSRGFAWLKYEDQRSTDLAVDNLGGSTVLGRVISVDHARYTKKDEDDNEDEFIVAFEDPDQGKEQEPERHRHHHRRHKHRRDRETRSHRSPKQLEDELNRSDEDPMKDYLAKERSERRDRRGSRERVRSRDTHRGNGRDSRREEYDETERSSHRHHRHRSPRS